MDLTFERGRADAPAGHALVYFTNPSDGATLATYLVVLPIALQLAKYIPPMLAAQLPLGDMRNAGAVPLPPVPETVESRAQLERLAELRRDDLISAGNINPGDLGRSMATIAEVAQRYHQLYEQALARAPLPEKTPEAEEVSDVSASDVIYDLMSEQQKLAELAKLAGQLRYAVDGGDRRQVADLTQDLQRIGRHLPATYQIDAFINAAGRPDSVGRQLSSLYLDRCYKLANEDYTGLAQLDREIARLNAGTG
jgi:hypothetical protein